MMRPPPWYITVPVFFLSLASRTNAQDETFGPSAEQFLVNFSGSYTYTTNDFLNTENVSLNMGLGYFATRAHEYGADLFVQYQKTALDIGGGSQSDVYAILPYYNYNYYPSPGSRFSLHGGPHLEFFSLDGGGGRDNDWGYGFQVGARYWITPSIGLSIEPRYTHRFLSGSGVSSEDEFQTLFGLNFVL